MFCSTSHGSQTTKSRGVFAPLDWELIPQSRLGHDRFRRSQWYDSFFTTSICVNWLAQYLIANLGMSNNFADVDLGHLPFPSSMRVDYIRVYQRKDSINIGCNPKNFPTQDYINKYVLTNKLGLKRQTVDSFGLP